MSKEQILLAVIFYGVLMLCTLFAFIFGAINYFKKGKPLFCQLVTCAMGCFTMAYIFELLQIFITKNIETGFQVGNLGIIGGMAFLFTASFGELDDKVDDKKDKSLLKYRLIALLAPLLILLIYVPSLFTSNTIETKIVTLIQFIFIGPAAYYSFKHLLLPNDKLGIVKPIKIYSLIELLIELFITLELSAINHGSTLFMIIFVVISSILFILIIPFLKKGVKKWTQQ